MRRLVSLLLAALLLLGLPLPALAEDGAAVEIKTAEDFAAFARACALRLAILAFSAAFNRSSRGERDLAGCGLSFLLSMSCVIKQHKNRPERACTSTQ